MATTGFWPVKGRLREVLAYAKNPDKTTEEKYLDDDLRVAIDYAENSNKTDKQMYVSGINCSKHRAYEEMCAVKQKYGERGKVIAYHGYQSFEAGEVTPEEAHEIGKETARRMWGDRFQVLVTTHLNTDNLHNHFVINATSFKDGKKYRNQIGDHMELRKVSDAVCREHGKSVLENAPFYGGQKKDYWLKQSGQLSHREMLRKDIEDALEYVTDFQDFQRYMYTLGYRAPHGYKGAHISLIGPGWQRPIRIDRLNKNYTLEGITKRVNQNRENENIIVFYNSPPKVRRPYYPQVYRYYKSDSSLITLLFEIVIQILQMSAALEYDNLKQCPVSPAMRAELARLDQTLAQYHFLRDNQIETITDLTAFSEQVRKQIEAYEKERQKLRNQIRRAKTPERELELKEQCKEISKKLSPLRKQKKLIADITKKVPRLRELLKEEFDLENGKFYVRYEDPHRTRRYHQPQKTKERNYER
ncbi:MAG: relaxase/mobilization nuclease domain-containing protein [Clostridia bacterium]|nr:relaxase/mobilization nuclease domain-containing protein [Clostridia bacterium]